MKKFVSVTALVGLLGACDADPIDGPSSDVEVGQPDGTEVRPEPEPWGEGAVAVRYDVASDDYTAVPWPNDRSMKNGRPRLTNYPDAHVGMVELYTEYGEEALDGWGRNGAIYFQMEGRLDEGSLPSTRTTRLESRSPVRLIEVATGKQLPLLMRWVDDETDRFYLGPTLAVRPEIGFPLDDAATYCAVVTRELLGEDGEHLAVSEAFQKDLEEAPYLAPLRDFLVEEGIFVPEDLAAATCFTTQDATLEMRAIEQHARTAEVAPNLGVVFRGGFPNYYEFQGEYEAPNFQAGRKPYLNEGGDIQLDAEGRPVVQDTEIMRYRLLLPRDREMPEGGWPVALYGHGTTGDWTSCSTGNQKQVMDEGIAMICIDQPLHGSRTTTGNSNDVDEMVIFNYLNPRSGRTSFRQSAADFLWLSRLVSEGMMDIPAGKTEYPDEIRLDPEQIVYFGHSHGGLGGIIALALDGRIKGGVFSGASGVLIETILRRKDYFDIQALVAMAVKLESHQLDIFHPVMSMAQMLVDATDPINYAGYWLDDRFSQKAKSIFMTEGTEDEASPAVGANAVAAAGGLPLIGPVFLESAGHDEREMAVVTSKLEGNLTSVLGTVVTGGIRQFDGGDHFVALYDEVAIRMWREFLVSLVGEGGATLTP